MGKVPDPHRIDQLPTGSGYLWPAGPQQNGRRQIFLQGRLATIDAVSAFVQTVAGQINAQRRLIPVQI